MSCDEDELQALAVAQQQRWTERDEMAALTVDLLYALHRSFVAVHTPKQHARTVPQPWAYPRPHQRTDDAQRRTVTPRGLALLLASGGTHGTR